MSKKHMSTSRLQAAFQFTDADLDYNRELEASPAQYQRYTTRLLRDQPASLQANRLIPAVLMGIGSLLAIGTGIYLVREFIQYIASNTNNPPPGLLVMVMLLIVITVTGMIAFLRLIFNELKRSVSQQQSTVQTAPPVPEAHPEPGFIKISVVQGIIGLYNTTERDSWDVERKQYYVRVEDREFNLTSDQYLTLRHTHIYRFYYIPENNQILSVEKIGSA